MMIVNESSRINLHAHKGRTFNEIIQKTFLFLLRRLQRAWPLSLGYPFLRAQKTAIKLDKSNTKVLSNCIGKALNCLLMANNYLNLIRMGFFCTECATEASSEASEIKNIKNIPNEMRI